ncbi:HEAT repeat domain-containing protein, partial [Nocardia salmonicida]
APLSEALTDRHLDVRKAAVLALSTWPSSAAALDALESAIADPDADVRAYARRAVTAAGRDPVDAVRADAALTEASA